MSQLDARAEHLLRELTPQVLGAIIRRFRDFGAAEDDVQEALVAARERSDARKFVGAYRSPATSRAPPFRAGRRRITPNHPPL